MKVSTIILGNLCSPLMLRIGYWSMGKGGVDQSARFVFLGLEMWKKLDRRFNDLE